MTGVLTMIVEVIRLSEFTPSVLKVINHSSTHCHINVVWTKHFWYLTVNLRFVRVFFECWQLKHENYLKKWNSDFFVFKRYSRSHIGRRNVSGSHVSINQRTHRTVVPIYGLWKAQCFSLKGQTARDKPTCFRDYKTIYVQSML